jgi:hypothetical protein
MTDTLTLQKRAERLFRPGRVDFDYRYCHDTCCAEVIFSDGERCWCFWPSNILGDALHALLDALAHMRRYEETTAHARWLDEPGEWHWVFRRERDQLSITVLTHDSFFIDSPHRPVGRLFLETHVDFVKFLQRLRLAASRIATMPVGEQRRYLSFEEDLAYGEICRFLDSQRRAS